MVSPAGDMVVIVLPKVGEKILFWMSMEDEQETYLKADENSFDGISSMGSLRQCISCGLSNGDDDDPYELCLEELVPYCDFEREYPRFKKKLNALKTPTAISAVVLATINDVLIDSGSEWHIEWIKYDFAANAVGSGCESVASHWYDSNDWKDDRNEESFRDLILSLGDKPCSRSHDFKMMKKSSGKRPKTAEDMQEVLQIKNGIVQKCLDPDLTDCTVPEGVTEILDTAFANCKKLKKVELPNTLRKIGEKAFLNCMRLASVNFPEGLEEIHIAAFKRCALKEILLPDTVRFIGDAAFSRCENLQTVRLSKKITDYADCGLEWCDDTTVILPDGMEIDEIDGGTHGDVDISECTIKSE